jgi:adenylyl-sulfate kinase
MLARRRGEAAAAGAVVWLTGLPSAGKTTLGAGLALAFAQLGLSADHLDGDAMRRRLSPDLGFSRADRQANVVRVAWVASRIARAGALVVVSLISPHAIGRRLARDMIEPTSAFFEVHVATPLDECVLRDTKGLYAAARRGKLELLTGVSDDYETPTHADLTIDTTGRLADDCVRELRGGVLGRLNIPNAGTVPSRTSEHELAMFDSTGPASLDFASVIAAIDGVDSAT